MKMTKKVLFGAAILAMVFGFASCKNEDDDPEGAIKGSNNDYTVFYDNTNGYAQDTSADVKTSDSGTGVYRAWKRTSLKHLGALTKITLKAGKDTGSVASKAGNKSGVMGFAWDLQTATGTETDSDTTAENFNVVGIRNWNGTLYAYVSRYYNITNKQNNNFGVASANSKTTDFPTAPAAASEYDVSGGFKSLGISATTDEVSVWVDVAIVPPTTASAGDKAKCGTASTRALSEYTSAAPGSWVIAIYDSDPKTATSNLTPKGKWVINAKTASAAGSGYDASTINLSTSQKKQAVYANIYKGATLSGAWNYADTYFKVEPVVDAE